LNLSTLHLHLDARRCLEVAVLQGSAKQLREVADQVSAERGVRLGDLRLIAEAPQDGQPPARAAACKTHSGLQA
ncbi:MAG: nickel-responsive transcriptional regulator NikR, partial [Geminicoccaceae bacterium]